jgi:CRP-like cAMP-binding protein
MNSGTADIFPIEAINEITRLSNEELALVLECGTFAGLRKGQVILPLGEVCRAFYYVQKGHLRTWYDKDGEAINFNFTFEGEATADLQSFRRKTGSDVVIEAGEDSQVYIFNIDTVTKRLGGNPAISKFFRRLALKALLDSEAHSNLFKIYTPTERYHFIEQNKPKLLQRIPLSQLASYLGVKRETLSRIRAKK